MASNTLIAYPIAVRYGLQRHRSVALSVGSTMLALFIALMVLAGVTTSFDADSHWWFWPMFLFKVAAFCAGMILIIPRITRKFLRRYSDAVMQFIFIMAELFLSAALSEAVGLEGIFGAFLAGLILNRYIPRLSSLMNRIEFTGNAIFIPYFLIGVGMLINLRLLFHGGAIVWIAAAMVAVGMIGKALAAYAACIGFKMPLSSGHMMFGLTSAHAAGGIAMVMVGMRLEVSPGHPMVDDDMLNGVIIMILFTCIISTLVTERSARQLVIADKAQDIKQAETDDEKILLPVKYPDVAKGLVSMAIMMRNAKLNRGLVALNVVYDDKHRASG
jgi:Kef-type K+ transport system membrane component KefB